MSRPVARPTRRGIALLAVVVVALLLARRDGARALGAVVFPGAVALLAGFVAVSLVEEPRVTRVLPPAGQRGETGTVRLVVDAEGALATVRDNLPAGLSGDGTVGNVLGEGPVAYEVTYVDRGEQAVGPARVTVRDVLGLVTRTFGVGGTDALTVYPRTTPLSPGGRNRLLAVVGSGTGPERDEFDHLREYAAGDSLRDVNWKASARRDDLVVDEYAAADVAERVVVVAEAESVDAGGEDAPTDGPAVTASPADRMAEATASVALALLEAGVPVTVRTPTGAVTADVGDRAELLGHLARTTAGRVSEDPDTAVHVRATAAGVRVRLGDVETTFDDLRGDPVASGDTPADQGTATPTEPGAGAERTGEDSDDAVATEVAQ